MKTLSPDEVRGAWELAWTYTGRTDAAVSCLARASAALDALPPQNREPARRRALWRAVADACREQVSVKAPGFPESPDPRLATILDLPLELREALLLLKYHGLSAEDLGNALGCTPAAGLGRAQRALSRIALRLAMPSP